MENAVALRGEESPMTLADRKQQTSEIIEMASHWASCLMSVVEKCGMSKNLGGKKYLEVEGWLMIAEFAHVRSVVEWVRVWKDDDASVLGYEARVQLFNENDQVVGAGESSCGLDAFPCRGKQGSEKDKAAKSAAQTWATSRALRNKFSYVAKMAGYQAVPAEEMNHLPADLTKPLADSIKRLKTAKATLGDAILGYTNGDKKAAQEVLEGLTGKTTLTQVSEAEAITAMRKFELEYLAAQPGDDKPDDDIRY